MDLSFQSTTKKIQKKIIVLHYERAPRKFGNFSIERYFAVIRRRLAADSVVNIRQVIAPCKSNGVFRRVLVIIHAWLVRERINHQPGDIHFACILWPKRRSILTINDLGFLNCPPGIRRFLLKLFWLRLPVARASIVTTISEYSAAEIRRHLGRQQVDLRVIPIPLDPEFEYVPKAFNQEKPLVLQIGTTENKNLANLSEALKGLTCKLVIVGFLNSAQKTLLVSNGIEFEQLTAPTNQEIIELYIASDLVTLVSTFEGFGMPIIEAQAVGRPVLTSDLEPMRSVAGAGAYLVDPHSVQSIRQGFNRIVQDATYREGLVSAGRLNTSRFSAQSIAMSYRDLYLELNAEK